MPLEYDQLQSSLEKFIQTSKFLASVVSTSDGLVVASAIRKGLDQNLTAALSALVDQTVDRVKNDLKLGNVRYFLIEADLGKLVFKKIVVDEEPILLTFLIPKEIRYFKRKIRAFEKLVKQFLSS
ncbi:MAG: hypothetical protein ACP6IS_03945 [Candidatus Asgardarchaeia archaeon]